jgi:vitamin B12 transporter
VSLSAEAGSYGTYRESASISGSTGIVDFAFTATRMDTDGFSAANEADGNTEADGYEQTGFSGKLGISPLDNLSFDLVARYSDSSVDYDNGAGVGADASNNVADAERVFLGGTADLGLLDSQWQQSVRVSQGMQRRDFTSDWGENWFDAEQTKLGWQHDLYYEDINVLSAGVEVEKETAETDSLTEVDSEIKSLFVQDQLRLGRATLVGGLRLDDHDTFGEEVTGRVGATIRALDGKERAVRVKGTYGTGFKAPSLYQLYAPASPWGVIGNPDLQPETSTSVDAGVEVDLADARVTLGATGFYSEYDDLIDFEVGYVNLSSAKIRGGELMARVKVTDAMSVGGAYTYTDGEDEEGHTLSRRTRHRALMDVRYDWGDDVDVSLACMYVGEREDSYFSSTEYVAVSEQLPGYTVVNLAASWSVSRRVKVFGRIENLFDEEYEELAGYGTPGISGYGGVRVAL